MIVYPAAKLGQAVQITAVRYQIGALEVATVQHRDGVASLVHGIERIVGIPCAEYGQLLAQYGAVRLAADRACILYGIAYRRIAAA